MKKRVKYIAAALCLALLSGCGGVTEQANQTAYAPVQESEQAAQEITTLDYDPNWTTAEIEQKRAELPEKEFVEYMNERAKIMFKCDYIKYNLATDSYYDTTVKQWNGYRFIPASNKPLTDEELEEAIAESDAKEAEKKAQCAALPDDLRQAFDTYADAMKADSAEHPEYIFRSDVRYDDGKGAYQALCKAAAPHMDLIWQLAMDDNSSFQSYCQRIVIGILGRSGAGIESADSFLHSQREYMYQPAQDAVNAIGDAITAEDCASLQAEYGYMIAPALKSLGKLDLMQIDPESPCTDAEQLAAFAAQFA